MATTSTERARLRRTLLWFALAGVALAAVLFVGGSLLGTFLAHRPAPAATMGSLNITAANDANADGTINRLNQDEHPVVVDLTLTSHTGEVPRMVTTDQAGFAAVDHLPIDSYDIAAFVADTQVSVVPATVTVASGSPTQLSLALNPAGKHLGGVRGTAYEDTNGDGVIGATDMPITGAAVTLLSDSTVRAMGTTDSKGRYSFTPLDPGSYLVRLVVPKDQQQRFRFATALSTVAEVRSHIDQRSLDFLLPLKATALLRLTYRLAATTLSPGLDVTKLASDADQVDQEFVTTAPGSEVSFRITVEALGGTSDTYSNVSVVDDYPVGLQPHDIAGGGSDDGNAITWNLGTLTGSQTAVLTYGATIAPSAAEGSYRNVATVTSPDTLTVDDDSTVLVRAASTPATTTSNDLGIEPGEPGTTAAGTTAASTSTGTTAVSVGVPAWQLALIVALPAVAILAVLVVGLRRARTQ